MKTTPEQSSRDLWAVIIINIASGKNEGTIRSKCQRRTFHTMTDMMADVRLPVRTVTDIHAL